MTLEELRKLVADGEGDHVEFKESTGQRIEACRTLCAFLNGDGGTVVFGVTKKGQLTGQLVSDEFSRQPPRVRKYHRIAVRGDGVLLQALELVRRREGPLPRRGTGDTGGGPARGNHQCTCPQTVFK